jgi:hypothetical protein
VTHGANEVLADETSQPDEYARIFELRDGRIVSRIEYHRNEY